MISLAVQVKTAEEMERADFKKKLDQRHPQVIQNCFLFPKVC